MFSKGFFPTVVKSWDCVVKVTVFTKHFYVQGALKNIVGKGVDYMTAWRLQWAVCLTKGGYTHFTLLFFPQCFLLYQVMNSCNLASFSMSSANAFSFDDYYCCFIRVNPLPYEIFLDMSVLKAFADNKINVTKNQKFNLENGR